MSERVKYPEWISRYNSGEMDPAEREHFEQLMEKDSRLRAEVRLDREINEMMSDPGLLDLRQKMRSMRETGRKNNRTYLLLAASLLILLTSGIFMTITLMNRNDRYWDIASADGLGFGYAPGFTDPDLPLELRPDPQYEMMIGALRRSIGFIQLQPKIDQKFEKNGNILFEWHTHTANKVTIEVLNNEGKLMLSATPEGDKKRFILDIKEFPTGLYYYKIIEDEDLVFIGKFILE